MKVTFTKISNNHNKLRDDVIVGTSLELPTEGESFRLVAPPRDIRVGIRDVQTSPVTKIVDHNIIDKVIKFETESGSLYQVSYE